MAVLGKATYAAHVGLLLFLYERLYQYSLRVNALTQYTTTLCAHDHSYSLSFI